jgi:hypothetical protein
MDGLEDYTMYGKLIMANENKINWTLVVLVTIICIGLWLIPSPLQSGKPIPVVAHDTTYVMYGVPDTTQHYLPEHHGHSTSTVTASTSSDTGNIFYPFSFQDSVEIHEKEGTLRLRTTVYTYTENDTLKAQFQKDYNWQPRPAEIIIRIDTVYLIKTIIVPEKRPFYEEPLFVAPATASAALGLIYLISRILK